MYNHYFKSNTIHATIKGGSIMSELNDYDTWKSFLANKLELAEEQGMTDKTISNVAFEIGNYLSENIEASNESTQAITELWKVASEKEQQAIANAMVKLVKDQGN